MEYVLLVVWLIEKDLKEEYELLIYQYELVEKY